MHFRPLGSLRSSALWALAFRVFRGFRVLRVTLRVSRAHFLEDITTTAAPTVAGLPAGSPRMGSPSEARIEGLDP